jgi:iron complex outermembrane receptor protein
MKKTTFFTLILLFIANISFAQNTVKGIVLDNKTQEPIAMAVVKLIDNNTYTLTKNDGTFNINASEGSQATVSLLGYKTKTVNLKNNLVIDLEESPISLENIVVIGENISQATIITNEEKRLTQPRNVADMFGDAVGFALVKRSTYAIDPVLRSFSEERLNIQYDCGMKTTNACPNRMDPVTTHIAPEEIEKIEVIRGPFAVRFGSNFGGVINLQSKSAASYKEGLHGNLETGFEANGGSFTGRGGIIYKKNKFDFNTSLEYRNYKDYSDGNGDTVPASFNAFDYSIKTGYNATEKQRIQLTWRQTFARDIMHAGLPMDSPKDDSYLLGFDYIYKDLSPKIKSLKTKIYYSYVDHIMDNFLRPSFMAKAVSTPVQSNMLGGKIELNIATSKKSNWFVGLDMENKSRDGDKFIEIKKNMMGMPIDPHIFKTMDVWQEGFVNDFGVFAETQFKLNNGYKLSLGVRTDFVNAGMNKPSPMFESVVGGAVADQTEANFSGFISLKKRFDNGEYQFSFGSGVKTGSMTERFINRFTLGNDPYELIGNPYIKPERNNQFEFSFVKNISNTRIGANIFYSFINDMIIGKIDPTTASTGMSMMPFVKRFVNISDATQYGGELYFDYSFNDNWSTHTDVSYTYAHNGDWDEPLAHIAPLRSHLNIKYKKAKFWGLAEGKFVADQDRFAPQSGEMRTPGYGVFNLKAGYKLSDKMNFGMSILNLFDRAYADHMNFSYKNTSINSGRVLEMGRNITAQLTYKF